MFSQTQANADTAAKVSRLMRGACQQKQRVVRMSIFILDVPKLAGQPVLILAVVVRPEKKNKPTPSRS